MGIAISAQISNLIRWAMASIVIYVALPAIIFPVSEEGLLERFFSRYIRMVATVILVVYVLVLLKLYEVLSIFIVFLGLEVIFKFSVKTPKNTFRSISINFFIYILNFMDYPVKSMQSMQQHMMREFNKVKTKIIQFIRPNNALQALSLVCVLAYSIYLRYYDTLTHAAPAMSDAYVILAWTKYIDARMLFHDGIYPQGYFIYLSILHKFAACDVLYILKYTGPLNGVLTALGIYLLVVKVTGRKLPGMISAFVYGVPGGILSYSWDRQGASLPQEFGMVFLFPAWYYALSFLQTRKRQDLWTAALACAVIGLVHSLILAFFWVGLVCLVSAYLLLNYRQTLQSVKHLIFAGIITGIVAALPVPFALLAGEKFHFSSLEALTSITSQVRIPSVTLIDTLACMGFILTLIISVKKRKAGSDLSMDLFIFLLGISSFLMYLFLGPLTGSTILIGRMGCLWSVLTAVGVGLLAEVLLKLTPGAQNTPKLTVASILALFLMAWAVIYYKPLPALPYKMQYDAEINQYLRICKDYTPAEWTIVAPEEGYDLVLGKGWHISIEDFLSWYDPQNSKLVRKLNGNEEPLLSKDIFIFYQKKLFKVDVKEMVPILAQRAKDYAALVQWVAKFKEIHDVSVYYQDDYIEIFHIHQS